MALWKNLSIIFGISIVSAVSYSVYFKEDFEKEIIFQARRSLKQTLDEEGSSKIYFKADARDLKIYGEFKSLDDRSKLLKDLQTIKSIRVVEDYSKVSALRVIENQCEDNKELSCPEQEPQIITKEVIREKKVIKEVEVKVKPKIKIDEFYVYFNFDSSKPHNLEKENLEKFIKPYFLNTNEDKQDDKKVYFEIEAHADIRGEDPYNLKLSSLRAFSIFEILEKSGIQIEDIHYKTYGERRPVTESLITSSSNDNKRSIHHDKHRLNRRVIIKRISEEDAS